MIKFYTVIYLILIYLLFPVNVFAHAFGVQYTLPIPLVFYLYGAAVALLASFIIFGIFISQKKYSENFFNLFLLHFKNYWFIKSLKIISISLLFITILTGLFGINASSLNFNMTFFWIIFWLGFSYLTIFFGNFWQYLDPWKILIDKIENLINLQFSGLVKLPRRLGYFPAFIFYFLFIYLELFGQTTPNKLSIFLILYSVINILGSLIFGKASWFKYFEFFSVYFNIISKISPIFFKNKKIYLKIPFSGLITERVESFSLLLFILFILSSTAFDSFRETIIWYSFISNSLASFNPLTAVYVFNFMQPFALFLSPFIFLFIYMIALYFVKLVTRINKSLDQLALDFAFSLVPIAIVYNIAHYYTLLLTEGQNFIKIISDPFGIGWNLFNTNLFRPNLSIINAGITWHFQVGLILLGHIISIYLAHLISLKVYPNHKKAIISQLPMLILMVIFTTIGLWILSQPLGK